MQGVPAIILHGGAGKAAGAQAEQTPGLLASARRGWSVLQARGGALEAVVEAVVALENEPGFNAGYGSVLTADGTVEMDASLMDGRTLAAGAVAVVAGVRNPIRLAHAVLARGPHVFLAGDAARRRAADWGLDVCDPGELITAHQRERWRVAERERSAARDAPADEDRNTVGAVAIDTAGHVAAATSTGGMFGKWSGRIGDSAVIGAGTYADDAAGAASATGHGEAILRLAMARHATALLLSGLDPQRAAEQAVGDLGRRTGGEGGLIVIDALGRLGWAVRAGHMSVAWCCGDMREPEFASVSMGR